MANKPRIKERTLSRYERTRVQDIGAIAGPDGGAAVVVQFERTVEIDGNHFTFPLNRGQIMSLTKMLGGILAQHELDKAILSAEDMVML